MFLPSYQLTLRQNNAHASGTVQELRNDQRGEGGHSMCDSL